MLENEAEHPRRRESWNPELKMSNNETFNFVDRCQGLVGKHTSVLCDRLVGDGSSVEAGPHLLKVASFQGL